MSFRRRDIHKILFKKDSVSSIIGVLRIVMFLGFFSLFSGSLCLFGADQILAPPSSYPSPFRQENVRVLVDKNDFHSAILMLDQWANESENTQDKAFLFVEKAKVLYVNQQRVEALEVFLEALKSAPIGSKTVLSDDEQKVFLSLFPLYEESIQSPELGSRLSEQSKALLQAHPEYTSLRFYLATGLANQGKFVEFFDCFYSAFQARRDCFLSWKTIGVLHMRLFEASTSEEVRETHRREAAQCLRQAFALQPQDGALLVKLVFILPPVEKKLFLKTVANGLLALHVPICRRDCFFLIQQAIDVDEFLVAKQLIEIAGTWYQYSRGLQELSEQLQKCTPRPVDDIVNNKEKS